MFILPLKGIGFDIKSCSNHRKNNRTLMSLNSVEQLSYDSISFCGKLPVKNVFDNYGPVHKLFDNYEITIHNKEIAKRLSESYTFKTFKTLFHFAENNGVFKLDINPDTHYVKTSLISQAENPLMSKLVWVTDSCNYMPVIKDKYPQNAVPLMENISSFYKKQERYFNKVIHNPLEYELNHDGAFTAKIGIGHVFNPANMRSHKWFPHTRLESAGLYLKTISELIKDGLNGAKYGYKNASDISQNTIDAITNITAYLEKIVYPYSKSTGPWEEKTFNITPSSDTAVINEGFRKIIDLMYSPSDNAEILKVRKRLLAAKNGGIFKDENRLKNMLKIGEYRIKSNSTEEIPARFERIFDAALSFIPHTEKFDDDAYKDALEIMNRMNYLERGKIVRANGVIRYEGDRYLNMTSGHKVNNSKSLLLGTEAQWFMSSDISRSYGTAVKRLLDKIAQEGKADEKTTQLLNKALRKETEYINRAYARITGENSFKANGKECPSFQVPEAYQAVTNSKDEIIFVPGTHTPLGWAQASLYNASKLLLENLKRIEKLNSL